MGGLIILAWLTLWLWGQSPYGRLLNHDELSGPDLSNGLVVLVIVVGWILMIVAMMLPTSLPLVALFHRLTRQRGPGAADGSGDRWVSQHVDRLWRGRPCRRRTPARGHSTERLAGSTCLGYWRGHLNASRPVSVRAPEICLPRQVPLPLGFITEHWRGSQERAQAFRLGVHHGLFCIGCCWSLMLLMFTVGIGNLGWMLVLGAVMAIEKNLPWGRRVSAPLGVGLVCWGLVLGLAAVLT